MTRRKYFLGLLLTAVIVLVMLGLLLSTRRDHGVSSEFTFHGVDIVFEGPLQARFEITPTAIEWTHRNGENVHFDGRNLFLNGKQIGVAEPGDTIVIKPCETIRLQIFDSSD